MREEPTGDTNAGRTGYRKETRLTDPLHLSGKPLNPHLRIAVLTGVQAAARVRIDRGDDVNAIDHKGRSPLILAASRGHLETCRLLLDSGADPAARDLEGNDALGLAIAGGHARIVALLHERLAPLVESPSDGLREAPAGYPSLSARLEARGPDVDAPVADEDEDELGLAVWEPDPESPPPPADPGVPARAGAFQHAISVHIPIDTDEDWSDVYIDLIESPSRSAQKAPGPSSRSSRPIAVTNSRVPARSDGESMVEGATRDPAGP